MKIKINKQIILEEMAKPNSIFNPHTGLTKPMVDHENPLADINIANTVAETKGWPVYPYDSASTTTQIRNQKDWDKIVDSKIKEKEGENQNPFEHEPEMHTKIKENLFGDEREIHQGYTKDGTPTKNEIANTKERYM